MSPSSEGGSTGFPGPGDTFAEEGVELIRGRSSVSPRVAIVLGSGLADAVAGDATPEQEFPYQTLPGFPPSSVPGHAGRLIVGRLYGIAVAMFLGRIFMIIPIMGIGGSLAAKKRIAESAGTFPVDGPLFTYALFKAAPDRFFWYSRYHHVVMDGFGFALVAQGVDRRRARLSGDRSRQARLAVARPVPRARQHPGAAGQAARARSQG